MNELEYLIDKLQNKLLDDNIEVSDDNLKSVINVYDNLYNFLEEQHLTNISKYRYQFAHTKSWNTNDETNYEIFKSLIELQSFKAFYLLDYPTLLHKFTGGMYNFNNMLNAVSKLDLLLSTYLTYLYSSYDDLEEMYVRDHFDVLERTINCNYKDLIDSKFLDSDYKDILAKYNEIFIKYYELIDHDEYYRDTLFDYFLNISFAYLIVNDKMNSNYKEIMTFLNRVDESIEEINHKLIVSDIETEEEVLNFVKSFYKNNKILNKKQIK